MRRTVAVVSAALLLAGCVTVERRYFDASLAPAPDAAARKCRFEAARGAVGAYDPTPFIAASNRADAEARLMRLCMEAEGYSARLVRRAQDGTETVLPAR